MSKEVSRKRQRLAKDKSCRTGVQVRLDLDPLTQKNPWKCLRPFVTMLVTHIYQGGLQRVFDSLMATLNGSIGLRMVSWGKVDFDIKGVHDVLVKVGDEGIPIVTHCQTWKAIP